MKLSQREKHRIGLRAGIPALLGEVNTHPARPFEYVAF
jgi:hypothetical protein